MYGEDTEGLVTCEKCGDVHPKWMRKEAQTEQEGQNFWHDIVCPWCEDPHYHTATVTDYTKCLQKMAAKKGVRLKLADYNAIPYAWCLNTPTNDFLNAVEAVNNND